MSTGPRARPRLADRFFVEAMSPAFREDPYPLLRALPRPRPAAARRRHDLVRAGPCRGHDPAAPSPDVDRRAAARRDRGRQRARPQPHAQPAVHGPARPHAAARPGRPRLHARAASRSLRAATEAITAELLDAMPADSAARVDLIEAFAYPLPVRVICTPARRAGGRRGDLHRLVARHRPLARSLGPALARDRRPIDRRAATARLSRRPAGRAPPQGAGRRPAVGLAAVDVDGDRITVGRSVWRSPCCCWSRATRRR